MERYAVHGRKKTILDGFSDHIGHSVAPLTKKNYVFQVRKFLRDYVNNVDNSDELNTQLEKYLLEGTGEKRSYIRRRSILLFVDYLQQLGYEIDKERLENIKYRIHDRKEMQTLTYEETSRLVNLLREHDKHKLAVIIMLCFDTGARVRAILRLRKKDILNENGREQPSVYLREKGNRTLLRPVTNQTYFHLQEWLNIRKPTGDEYIFFERKKAHLPRKRLKEDDVSDMYHDLYSELKNFSKKHIKQSVSFHWIRRGAGVYWYKKTGKDIVAIQEFYGHESPEVTAKYLKLEGEKIKEMMQEEQREW